MATLPTTQTVSVGTKNKAADYNTFIRDDTAFIIAPPRLRVFNSAATLTLTTGVFTAMTWDAETYDTDSMHSTVTLTSRLIAVTAGLYAVSSFVGFAANATGLRGINLRKNAAGSNVGGTSISQTLAAPQNSTGAGVLVYDEVQMAASDYLEVFARQDSGGNLATTANTASGWATMRWVATS